MLSFNGKRIEKMKELPRIVAETEVGSKVSVEVWREGEIKKLTVILGELEVAETNGELDDGLVENEELSITELGMTIATMNSEIASKFQIEEDIGNIVIVDVENDSPAFKKDITPGTVIKRADRQDVQEVSDVLDALKEVKNRGSKALLLLLSDGKRERFVALNIKE